MDNDQLLTKVEALVVKLVELSAKREEHFQILERDFNLIEDLLRKSEERIDKTTTVTQLLVESLSIDVENARKMIDGFEKRLQEAKADKAETIARLENRIEWTEKRYDEIIEENRSLIAILHDKDRLIESLEDRLLLAQGNVTISGVNNQQSK